ncbi:hypothetical protein [Vibrio phage phiKT1024]|nr:hypothetical protein [Vibrio phage phiKT1024]
MFDANARHVEKNQMFFVKVVSVDDTNIFINKLLKREHVYACSKIEGDTNNYKMRIFLNKTFRDYITFEDSEDGDNDFRNYFVYSGRLDGTGFIDNQEMEKAFQFLGGKWQYN